MTKLLSVARPDIKRKNENVTKSVPNIVKTLPSIATTLAIIKIGKRPKNKKLIFNIFYKFLKFPHLPTISARIPNIRLPTTEPTKNIL